MPSDIYFSPFIPAFNSNGAPVPGAKLSFFYTGTDTLAPIYIDDALSSPLNNPVNADLAGRFPNVYLDSGITYRVRVLDPQGVPLGADIDPYIPGSIQGRDGKDGENAGAGFYDDGAWAVDPSKTVDDGVWG